MTQYPRTPTPISHADAARVLVERYVSAFGASPDRETATGLLTLMWHETAQGRSVIQYNWGNVSVPAKKLDSVPHWRPPWMDPEYLEQLPEGAKKTRLMHIREEALAGRAPVAFRAYFSHEAGADAWLKLLTTRFRNILRAAGTGDPRKLWRAVAWPAKEGGASYCPDCRDKAVLEQYRALHAQIGREGLFASLKKNGDPEKVVGLSLALARFSWRSTGQVGLPRLERGQEGDAVALWQLLCNRLLCDIGSPQLAVDGQFGERTHEATQRVQDGSGRRDESGIVSVIVDGVVRPETWGIAFLRGRL
jgi:peptidoglycan hydrolase-like protein with peptidoglycan-binding domain